ncbi:THUMP-like domain-containing protein [Mycolicibacterium mengxianglii]|uniref:THUMP-like domain-containing protein n=1 Tax=Mycolicibacterium mengxianglii TaxID=2736649 RepID=UPI001E361BC9|nr:class I SAM-dependent methyltransferase [Mycolicibacterium mengxianglii]
MVLQRHGHRGKAVLTFTLADVGYLTSDEGVAALAEVAELPLTDRVAAVAAVRARYGERAPALIETTLLRRRAAAKLPGAAGWLFTDEALQQATASAVAEHRGRRLAGRAVHDATCSIGTELAALQGVAAVLVGSDIDPVRLAMARHNLGAAGPLLCRADALRPITADTVVIVDPARRSGGSRRFDPKAYTPGLDQVLEVYRGRDLVVKVAPGVDFAAIAEMGFAGEIEVTSLGGSVREACLWGGSLTQAGVRRRASVLDTGEQLTDADPDDCAVGPAGRWIVDPDGAVVRAGLVRQYAARHRLWQLDRDIAYLTGDTVPDGMRGFEVLDQLPFTEKKLRQTLSALDCGALEILVRGVGVDPDALRRRLRLRGSQALSVVITRIGTGRDSRASAFVCRASR